MEKEQLRYEYREYMLSAIKGSFSAAKNGEYKGVDTSTKIMWGVVAFGVLLILVGMFTKNALLCLGTFAVLFFLSGLMTMIRGGGEQHADVLYNRLSGLILMLTATVPFLTWYIFMKYDPMLNKVLICFGVVMGLMALLLLVKIISILTSKNRVYTREIPATCIGYARYINYERHDNSYNRNNSFYTSRANPYVSPVFEYNFEGQDYMSVYDDFRADTDSDVPMGPCNIRISPMHPEGVYNPKPANVGIYIFFTIVLLFFAIFMFVLVGAGITSNVKKTGDGTYVLTENNGTETTASTKVILTDDMIKFNEVWYIEKVTIQSIETQSDGDIYTFDQSEFRKSKDYQTGVYKVGQEFYAIYTIDEESLNTGLTYKVVVNLIDPEEYDYQGSHGAWQK